MKQLATQFDSKGFRYKQLDRDGQIALFETRRIGGESIGYEVVVIQQRAAHTFPGQAETPAHEAMPSSEQWGTAGWSFVTREAGVLKMRLLATKGAKTHPEAANYKQSPGALQALALTIIVALASLTPGRAETATNAPVDPTVNTQGVKPFFTPPQIALATGTNWLSQTAAKIELSGIDLITFEGGKAALQRGGVATEYVIREVDTANGWRFRPGLAVVSPADLSRTYVGAACTFGVVPGGRAEAWLDQAPVFELVAKATKWSNLYAFFAVGSQVDKLNAFVSVGGGTKIW